MRVPTSTHDIANGHDAAVLREKAPGHRGVVVTAVVIVVVIVVVTADVIVVVTAFVVADVAIVEIAVVIAGMVVIRADRRRCARACNAAPGRPRMKSIVRPIGGPVQPSSGSDVRARPR